VLFMALLLYGAKVLRASPGQWAVAILMQLGCGFAGAMTAVMFNSRASDCITIGTEFAFRNSILAMGVISFAFSGDTREDMLIFAVIHSFMTTLLVLVLTPVFKCCSCGSKSDSSQLDAGLITSQGGRSDLSGRSGSTAHDSFY